MRSTVLRSLVLACSLLLVLPPGWCCMLAFQLSAHEAPGETPKPRTCCKHCRQAAPKAPTSRPAPTPLPSGECPCNDRLSMALDAPQSYHLDLSLPAPLPLIDFAFCLKTCTI